MLSLLQYWLSLRVKKILILRTVSDNNCLFNFYMKMKFLWTLREDVTEQCREFQHIRPIHEATGSCWFDENNWVCSSIGIWADILFLGGWSDSDQSRSCQWSKYWAKRCSCLTMLHDTESVRGLTALCNWSPGGQPQVPWIVENTEKMKSEFKHFLRQG